MVARKIILIIAGVLCALGLLGTVVGILYLENLEKGLPQAESLMKFQPDLPSVVYSADGQKIGEFFEEGRRYPVKYAEISPILVKAFIAAEDSRFFEHTGVDYQGILRASANFLAQGKARQGGSTITQQLAKIVLLSRERTFERKFKDIFLARKIERTLTKEQILELYLNNIFLGNHSYGVEAAARNYFRKSTSDLSIAEAAMIAGVTPAPSAYAPTESMQKAKVRQRFVLEQMLKNKFITAQQMDKALSETMKVHYAETPNLTAAPHFLMEVRRQVEKNLQISDLLSAGYRIETTLDMRMQNKVQTAIRSAMKKHENQRGFKGPVKRHGEKFHERLAEIAGKPIADGDIERGIVVDLYPQLDAVGVVTQSGLGVLLAEDHRWALATSKGRDSSVLDFATILAVGDEVNVRKLSRGSPKRIVNGVDRLRGLVRYASEFEGGPRHEGVVYYELSDIEGVEAAALIMNARSGDVVAMIGGLDFATSQFNRATQSKRQVGSSVKPLYFTYALDQGFSPASLVDSPPIVIGDWKPENYGKEFVGRTTLRTSLIHSYNIPSIQLYQALGIKQTTRFLNRSFGFKWPDGDMSLALGSGNASLLQMVQSYSPFANSGRLAEARYIKQIVDRKGRVVYEANSDKLKVAPLEIPKDEKKAEKVEVSFDAKRDPLQIYSPEAAFVGLQMMRDVVRFGTGNAAAAIPYAAGKTGTTNGYTDAWFLGVVPNYVSGVWVGFDDARKSLGRDGTGGRTAAPIWKDVMAAALEAQPQKPKDWTIPEKVRTIKIDSDTGAVVTGGGGVTTYAIEGTEPNGPNPRHALGMLNTDGSSGAESEPSDSSSIRNLDNN